MAGARFETSHALWVPVSLVSIETLHEEIVRIIDEGRHEMILNVNAHAMNLAYEQPWLREIFTRAPIVFCDGAGVIAALRLISRDRVPERITYADWMWHLAALAEARGYRLFLLGAGDGVAAAAAAKLVERHPGLAIAGTHHGYFAKDGRDNAEVIAAINAAAPHILVVGFGMPAQERWIADNLPTLRANVVLSGGAVFDYVSGRVRRGPKLLTSHGTEWLARLAIEPRRLWRRYLLGNPKFMLRALRWAQTGR